MKPIYYLLGIIFLAIACTPPSTKSIIIVNPSGSQNTELEVYAPPTSTVELNQIIQTALPNVDNNYSFCWKDWNADGYEDLIAINKAGKDYCVIYILDGSTSFRSFLLQQPINFPSTASTTDFQLTYWNEDNIPDLLIFIKDKRTPVQVKVLDGAAKENEYAFYTELESFPLSFPDYEDKMLFHLVDYNMDNIEELEVINLESDSNVTVSFYGRDNNFNTKLQEQVTNLPNSQNGYHFAFGEFMTEGVKDLCIIDYTNQNNALIKLSYFLFGFRVTSVTLPFNYKNNFDALTLFSSKEIKSEIANLPEGAVIEFNPNPLLPGPGPKDLSVFEGKWETNHLLHSDDNNSISGIVIDYYEDKTTTTLNGLRQEMSITFEDGYKVLCIGENGHLDFYSEGDSKLLSKFDISYIGTYGFELTINKDPYTFYPYIDQTKMSHIQFTNSAGYISTISGSWSYVGFGGKNYNDSLGSTTLDAIFNTTKFVAIPSNAYNCIFKVEVEGGLNLSDIDLGDNSKFYIRPAIDGGCYRIKGTTFDPGYDRECSNEDGIAQALSDPYAAAIIDYFTEINLEKATDKIFEAATTGNLESILEIIDYKKLSKKLKSTFENEKESTWNISPWQNDYAALDNSLMENDLFQLINPQYSTNNSTDAMSEVLYYFGNSDITVDEVPGSISVGAGAEGAIIGGYLIETGKIISLGEGMDENNFFSILSSDIGYTSHGWTAGVQLGADVYACIGYQNGFPSQLTDGHAHGIGLVVGPGIGSGIIIWLNDDGEFVGLTVPLVFGVKFALNYQSIETTIHRK